MVDQAKRNAATAAVDVGFDAVGFGQLASLGKRFDAVLCLGNSLPHLLDSASVQQALIDFASVLLPGGILIIQNRNFDRVWATKERYMPPQSHREGEREWLFVRFYDYHEETITFNMVRLLHEKDGWTQSVESTQLRPVFCADLVSGLNAAGFGALELYGAYDRSAFIPDQSGDLIVVARKAGSF
jgi:hypothetical protein